MMGMWHFFVYALFPVPTLLLVLLSLPLPQFASRGVRKALLKVTNVIFFKIPVVKVSIFHIAMFLSTAALVMTSMDLMNKSKADDNTRFFEQKCQRWRAERNFWISILAFSMWMILRRFIAITREAQTYRDEIRKAEKTR